MVSTRQTAVEKTVQSIRSKLKDISNDVDAGAKRAAAPPSKTSDVGPPSTVPPVEQGITTRSRSAKKPQAKVEKKSQDDAKSNDDAEEVVAPTRLFDEAGATETTAVSSANGKKRKAEADGDDKYNKTRRVTRAAARKLSGGGEAEAVEAVDLTCDERLVADRGLILASGVSTSATEEVYPFSIEGGRRSNERKNSLAPYVQNGHLFSEGMRQDLVDWMSQQHGTLDLVDETLHLALRYLDTFLVRRGTEAFLARNGAGSEPVPALPLAALPEKQVMYLNDGEHQLLCNKLKRLGITCIFVAAKVTEVSAPSAYEFASAAEVSTFTRSQLLLAERALLRELDYYLYHPTSSSFSSAYLSVGGLYKLTLSLESASFLNP